MRSRLCQDLAFHTVMHISFSRLLIVECIGENIQFFNSGGYASFSDKNFDDEDSVDGNRPSSASSSSSKAPSSSRRNVSMGTTRRLVSSSLGSKSSGESTPCGVPGLSVTALACVCVVCARGVYTFWLSVFDWPVTALLILMSWPS